MSADIGIGVIVLLLTVIIYLVMYELKYRGREETATYADSNVSVVLTDELLSYYAHRFEFDDVYRTKQVTFNVFVQLNLEGRWLSN